MNKNCVMANPLLSGSEIHGLCFHPPPPHFTAHAPPPFPRPNPRLSSHGYAMLGYGLQCTIEDCTPDSSSQVGVGAFILFP